LAKQVNTQGEEYKAEDDTNLVRDIEFRDEDPDSLLQKARPP